MCCDWSRGRELLWHSDTGQGGICVQSIGEHWRHGAVSKTASVMETDKKKNPTTFSSTAEDWKLATVMKKADRKPAAAKARNLTRNGKLEKCCLSDLIPPSILSGWLLCAKQGAGCS